MVLNVVAPLLQCQSRQSMQEASIMRAKLKIRLLLLD